MQIPSRIYLILVLTLACSLTSPSPPPDLPTRLHDHLNTAIANTADARALWERLEAGKTPVSCAEIITVPPLFDLTVNQAKEAPLSLTVRDHINNGITALAQLSLLWEGECAQLNSTISIATLRQGEELLQKADEEFSAAETALDTWQ